MAFKKMMTSSGEGIMVIANTDTTKRYPLGFSYMLNGIIYTVKADITKDSHAEMRRLQLSNGEIEDVMVETISKDLQAKDCIILKTGVKEIDEPQPADQTETAIAEPIAIETPVIQKRGRGRPKKNS
jgi:hypothetical protein